MLGRPGPGWKKPDCGGIVDGMIRNWMEKLARRQVRRGLPASTRVYAIGDIHGRADLLRGLHEKITADAAGHAVDRKVAVYLGDYVDRGENSREVIDLLLDEPLPGMYSVFLLGNHEDAMLSFLDDPGVGANWVLNGGEATLMSYGVGHPRDGDLSERWRLIQAGLRKNLPSRHLEFLRSLELGHIEGGYLFVHAGIRPGLRFERQAREDMLWIRDEFLASSADHGVCVVHGHTITTSVEVLPNRIGIDTGAYFSGKLTCLVLEGEGHRLIQT